MKEFEVTLNKFNGLRSSSRRDRNTSRWVEFYNVVPVEDGIAFPGVYLDTEVPPEGTLIGYMSLPGIVYGGGLGVEVWPGPEPGIPWTVGGAVPGIPWTVGGAVGFDGTGAGTALVPISSGVNWGGIDGVYTHPPTYTYVTIFGKVEFVHYPFLANEADYSADTLDVVIWVGEEELRYEKLPITYELNYDFGIRAFPHSSRYTVRYSSVAFCVGDNVAVYCSLSKSGTLTPLKVTGFWYPDDKFEGLFLVKVTRDDGALGTVQTVDSRTTICIDYFVPWFPRHIRYTEIIGIPIEPDNWSVDDYGLWTYRYEDLDEEDPDNDFLRLGWYDEKIDMWIIPPFMYPYKTNSYNSHRDGYWIRIKDDHNFTSHYPYRYKTADMYALDDLVDPGEYEVQIPLYYLDSAIPIPARLYRASDARCGICPDFELSDGSIVPPDYFEDGVGSLYGQYIFLYEGAIRDVSKTVVSSIPFKVVHNIHPPVDWIGIYCPVLSGNVTFRITNGNLVVEQASGPFDEQHEEIVYDSAIGGMEIKHTIELIEFPEISGETRYYATIDQEDVWDMLLEYDF